MGYKLKECSVTLFAVFLGIVHILIGGMGLAGFLSQDTVLFQAGTGTGQVVVDNVPYDATLDLDVKMTLYAYELSGDIMGLPATFNNSVKSDSVKYTKAKRDLCRLDKSNAHNQSYDCTVMTSFSSTMSFYVATAYMSSLGAIALGMYLVLIGISCHCCGIRKRRSVAKTNTKRIKAAIQDGKSDYEVAEIGEYKRSHFILLSEYVAVIIDLVLFLLFLFGLIIFIVPKLWGDKFKRTMEDMVNVSSDYGELATWKFDWDPLETGLAVQLMIGASVLAFIVFVVLYFLRCHKCAQKTYKICDRCCGLQKRGCEKMCTKYTQLLKWCLEKPITIATGGMGAGCAWIWTQVGTGCIATGNGINTGCQKIPLCCEKVGKGISFILRMIGKGLAKFSKLFSCLCKWCKPEEVSDEVQTSRKVASSVSKSAKKSVPKSAIKAQEKAQKKAEKKEAKKAEKAQKKAEQKEIKKMEKEAKKAQKKKEKMDKKKEKYLGDDDDDEDEEDDAEDSDKEPRREKIKEDKKDKKKKGKKGKKGAAAAKDDDDEEDEKEPMSETDTQTDTESDFGALPKGPIELVSVGSESDAN